MHFSEVGFHVLGTPLTSTILAGGSRKGRLSVSQMNCQFVPFRHVLASSLHSPWHKETAEMGCGETCLDRHGKMDSRPEGVPFIGTRVFPVRSECSPNNTQMGQIVGKYGTKSLLHQTRGDTISNLVMRRNDRCRFPISVLGFRTHSE